MDEIGNLEALGPEHDLSGFDCGEAALNAWLNKHALKNQSRNNTRTFVLPTTEKCGRKVIAFYSLVVATLAHEDAIQPIKDGASPKHPIPVILLARLGVTKEYQGRQIGQALLKDALLRALGISQQVGVRAVIVHAKAGSAAFYQKFAGFAPSPTDPLHLLLPIQDIAAALK
jgi:predicted GNAT family N-acyltransferase